MKVETKEQLRQRIEFLEAENERLRAIIDKEQHEAWEANKYKAKLIAAKAIGKAITHWSQLSLQHIDKAGYWFTFRNEEDVQTYCVRHSEIEAFDKETIIN